MTDFHENIKKWVRLDNELTVLRKKTKEFRDVKNDLTHNLYTYAEKNDLDNATIEISNGTLKFQQLKQTSPLTFKLLEECLSDCIGDEEKVKHIIKYVKEKRQDKTSYIIKRSYTSL